jgi:hypothetical protein
MDRIPDVVSGFFSSAIPSCAAIFGEALKYESVLVPQAFLRKQHEELAVIYESFRAAREPRIGLVSLEHGIQA